MPDLFAIRLKGTDSFLPRPPSGQKGGSWVEPCPVTEKPPRFFPTIGAARSFLTQWVKGPVERKVSTDWETGYEDVIPEPNPSKAASPRYKEDYEIVEIYWEVKQ